MSIINLGNIWTAQNIKHKINTKINQNKTKNNKIRVVILDKRPPSVHRPKRVWGRVTWYLFHTIAANINEIYYSKNYIYIWNFIKKCCENLPCPICKNHALKYVKKIKMIQINNKNKLEKVLYDFHNHANKYANNPNYEWKNMSKYKNINVKKVFNLFRNHFFTFYYNKRNFSQWIRNKFKNEVNIFLYTIYKFMNI